VYESFYGMSATPFTRATPVSELLGTHASEEILSRLGYAAEQQLFAVVTGECGTGKTTLIRKFTENLDHSRFKPLYLADSKLTPRHFYKGLLEQMGCESKFYRGDAKRLLHQQVELMKGMHQLSPVVIVDEAHLLDREMLEELRFLLNFRMDAESPMALVLVGQSELQDRLRLQTFAAIRQRIDLQCRMPHFDRSETGGYMERQIEYSGAGRDLFTAAAVDEIHNWSGGAARLINKAATHCLIFGSGQGHRVIDDHMVRQVIDGELN